MEFGTTAVLIILVGIVILVVKTMVIVPQGFEYTRERLGKFCRPCHPDPHCLIPFLDRSDTRST